LALAEEAIAVCQRRGTRLYEFSGQLTRMRALRETQGLQATREIEAALAHADAWIEMRAAKSYEPFLRVERAELARLNGDAPSRERELREAHRELTEMGATIFGKAQDRLCQSGKSTCVIAIARDSCG
jgi:hypothetical protein